ncbi:MAG: TadE/TadG family type IV pilus assembly protein [Allopontixanthobacter sediminis]
MAFLRKLLDDRSGNALAIFGAALVPVTMMVGSGVDVSRTYMAKAKLQNACDAAVLAARQSMEGNAWTTANEAEADKFFDFNFPSGTYGVQNVVFTVAKDTVDNAQVVGSASATVPTSIMKVFGFATLDIAAECNAKRDLGHNDVVLVLDVTGSMASSPSTGGSSKIVRLREAAAGLYRALENDENGSVTRFGIVPYSHTVNVARSLRAADIQRDNVYVNTNSWNYQQCKVSNNQLYDCQSKTSTNKPTSGWVETNNGWRYNTNVNYPVTTRTVNINSTKWSDSTQTKGIDNFRTSGAGCIEERQSVGESTYVINSMITRADVDTAFSDSKIELRFGRYDPDSQRRWTQVGCPAEATKLRTYADEDDYQDAIDDATAKVTGGTYHDVGMLWGARFLSRTGFFSADNPTERSGVPVHQHLIFMTDGKIDVDDADGSNDLYSAHSLERFLDRTRGAGPNLQDHLSRFRSVCSMAKSMGMTIWVISLDVTDTTNIIPCATSDGHFFTSDGDDLEEVFERIGQGIGNLRLTK